jgi:8-oxo-dGTP pyrophosphatase MutT (NUDIX family)
MAKDSQDIIGVSAVVRDGSGRILLIKTAKAGWELPGGQVEPGEDCITALTREVREETGCEIDVGWFAPDTVVSLVTHAVEQVRLTDALGDDQGVIYRAYRRLPSDDPQGTRYEMLRLHRC